MSKPSDELESIELQLLLKAVACHYGFDFRNYSPASLKRRIAGFIEAEQLTTVSGLQEKVLHDRGCLERLLLALSVNVSAMFRDPGFFCMFREQVVPWLRTYPFIRIWCAGCSTGEEVYSLAILLQEEGLYDRCRIYATDMNEAVLRTAKEGRFPLALMREYTANYVNAGSQRSFSDYYVAACDHAMFRPSLMKNVVFAQHNLVTDGGFNQFNVVWCRNVMIYFNASLQARVHRLLYESLIPLGLLCLGRKESLRFTPHEKDYEALANDEKIYRRMR
jgi:chemotaxis protein methyltransferase CheR